MGKLEFNREEDGPFSDEEEDEKEEVKEAPTLKTISFHFNKLKNEFTSPELKKSYPFQEVNLPSDKSKRSVEKTKQERKLAINYKEENGIILLTDSEGEDSAS